MMILTNNLVENEHGVYHYVQQYTTPIKHIATQVIEFLYSNDDNIHGKKVNTN